MNIEDVKNIVDLDDFFRDLRDGLVEAGVVDVTPEPPEFLAEKIEPLTDPANDADYLAIFGSIPMGDQETVYDLLESLRDRVDQAKLDGGTFNIAPWIAEVFGIDEPQDPWRPGQPLEPDPDCLTIRNPATISCYTTWDCVWSRLSVGVELGMYYGHCFPRGGPQPEQMYCFCQGVAIPGWIVALAVFALCWWGGPVTLAALRAAIQRWLPVLRPAGAGG